MEHFKVRIVLEMTGYPNDHETVKEAVYSTLEEQINDDSLQYSIITDDDNMDEDIADDEDEEEDVDLDYTYTGIEDPEDDIA